jgi:hypothetical protein
LQYVRSASARINCRNEIGPIELESCCIVLISTPGEIGWSVIWNSAAKSFEMNQPPEGANWSIGNRGEELNPPMPVFDGSKRAPLPDAYVESPGSPVKPESLYLAQLAERLGPSALRNVGYK